MSDVKFLRCGACKYRWNWKCRTTCFKCNGRLGVPETKPPTPSGIWAKPKGGTSGAWTEATSRHNRKRNHLVSDKIETTKGPADASRLLESLRATLPSLADCAVLNALATKVEAERKAAHTAKPLSVKAKHLESRLAHKRRTQAEAHKRVEEAQEALAAAQQILEDASSECAARTRELQTLERDLADLPVEPHSSRAAGIELPAELEEDEEAAQAIAKADAAAHEARAFLAGKLRAKQTAGGSASRSYGQCCSCYWRC